ncbi:hypothetical protein MLD38_037966 [Melastoma candidum]|uniref:Uncharacterized protein n=1 Tax=Melastoma candidum TaxID=119954 RepID=A0ACB9KXJ4_9MYRT|nr:hypothetical protein MLD38_037966 [Melastoma candidum]
MFGCGQDNKDFIGTFDGFLGLSNDQISMVSQTSSRFGRYFSYCLPTSVASKGFLTFGNSSIRGPNPATLGYTPLVTVPQSSSFYGIKIIGISVGGTPLPPLSSKVLVNSSAMIDSGTVISRLPPTVYHALSSAIRKSLANYTMVPAVSIFDTCYDFSKVQTIPDPKIAISFSGGVTIDLDVSGIYFAGSLSQVCLAFAANSADSDLVIYGNTQQKTFEIIYDVAGRKLGFSPKGCS